MTQPHPIADADAIIRCEGLSKRFGDLVVLNKINLSIERGSTTAIIGPSGTGKSVLLKHIVGLLEPDAGHLWVGDIDMARATEAQKRGVRKRFGMLFQDGALFDSMSTGDNIAFPLLHHTTLSEDERRARVEEKLKLVELDGLYDRPTSALSGGQRKRVGLARAIIMEPEVVLFDEPNSGLDPITSDTIDALIGRMKRQLGITFVVITHDIVSAVSIADRIAMLYGGDVIEYAPTPMFVQSEQQVVRSFLARYIELSADGEPRRRTPERLFQT